MGLQKTPGTLLPNIREVREKPPSITISVCYEALDSVITQPSQSERNQTVGETNFAADSIDWDITLDSSLLEWDIGTVEATEENGNGLGPYEIVNASDLPNSADSEGIESHQTALTKEEFSAHEVAASEISWDISVENPETNVIDDAGFSGVHAEPHLFIPTTLSEVQDSTNERSTLLDTEYRNKILDNLFEVKAFLNQRLIELTNEETLSLQHQVQAVAPFVLQQFLDRLVKTLEEKKHHEIKLKEGLKDLAIRRIELQNSLSSSWPKQEVALAKTPRVKETL